MSEHVILPSVFLITHSFYWHKPKKTLNYIRILNLYLEFVLPFFIPSVFFMNSKCADTWKICLRILGRRSASKLQPFTYDYLSPTKISQCEYVYVCVNGKRLRFIYQTSCSRRFSTYSIVIK